MNAKSVNLFVEFPVKYPTSIPGDQKARMKQRVQEGQVLFGSMNDSEIKRVSDWLCEPSLKDNPPRDILKEITKGKPVAFCGILIECARKVNPKSYIEIMRFEEAYAAVHGFALDTRMARVAAHFLGACLCHRGNSKIRNQPLVAVEEDLFLTLRKDIEKAAREVELAQERHANLAALLDRLTSLKESLSDLPYDEVDKILKTVHRNSTKNAHGGN